MLYIYLFLHQNKQVRHLKRMNRCRGRAVQRRLSTLDSSQTSGSSGTETEPEVRGKRKIRKCRGYQRESILYHMV